MVDRTSDLTVLVVSVSSKLINNINLGFEYFEPRSAKGQDFKRKLRTGLKPSL